MSPSRLISSWMIRDRRCDQVALSSQIGLKAASQLGAGYLLSFRGSLKYNMTGWANRYRTREAIKQGVSTFSENILLVLECDCLGQSYRSRVYIGNIRDFIQMLASEGRPPDRLRPTEPISKSGLPDLAGFPNRRDCDTGSANLFQAGDPSCFWEPDHFATLFWVYHAFAQRNSTQWDFTGNAATGTDREGSILASRAARADHHFWNLIRLPSRKLH